MWKHAGKSTCKGPVAEGSQLCEPRVRALGAQVKPGRWQGKGRQGLVHLSRGLVHRESVGGF